VIPSLIKKVILFIHTNPHFQIFKNVTNLVVDHNTLIPSYISDTPLLIHLAFILFPQLGDNALEKIALEYLENEEAEEELEEEPEMTIAVNTYEDIVMEEKEDSDVEMLDGPPLGSQPQRRKILSRSKRNWMMSSRGAARESPRSLEGSRMKKVLKNIERRRK